MPIVFNARLHVIYRGFNNRVVSQSTLDGQNWFEPVELGDGVNSSDQTTVTLMSGSPSVFYKGSPGDSRIYYTSFSNDQWTPATQMDASINTSAGPAAFLASQVCLFYKGEGADQNIYLTVGGGSTWTLPPRAMGWLTDVAPTAIAGAGIYQVYYKNPDPAATISVQTTFDNSMQNWTRGVLPDGINTSDAPGPVISANRVNVFYKGSGADPKIYVASAVLPADPTAAMTWNAIPLPNGETTSAGPKAAFFNDSWYLFYKGAGADTTIYVSVLAQLF